MALQLIAPAKINLTLEVLGRQPDGYHEVASLMQTIDLADEVRLTEAASIELEVCGAPAGSLPEDAARNLAYRAAVALRDAAGRPSLGVRIELTKRIPAGAGLGGGSSDAAAVLRGLNRLWRLDMDDDALGRIAAGIGSDVSFFLQGGTAFATGRGEIIEALPDGEPFDGTLFLPAIEIEDKTRRMYALLMPEDYSDGAPTRSAVATVRRGRRLGDADLVNVFDRHLVELAPGAAEMMAFCRGAGFPVVAAGSGPSFFTRKRPDELPRAFLDVQRWGVDVSGFRSLSRQEALSLREV